MVNDSHNNTARKENRDRTGHKPETLKDRRCLGKSHLQPRTPFVIFPKTPRITLGLSWRQVKRTAALIAKVQYSRCWYYMRRHNVSKTKYYQISQKKRGNTDATHSRLKQSRVGRSHRNVYQPYLFLIHPWQHGCRSSGSHEQRKFLSLAWMLSQYTPSAHETSGTDAKPGIPHLPSDSIQVE